MAGVHAAYSSDGEMETLMWTWLRWKKLPVRLETPIACILFCNCWMMSSNHQLNVQSFSDHKSWLSTSPCWQTLCRMDIAHAKNVKNACAKEPVAVARQRMTLKEIERKAKARTADRNRKRSNDQRERERDRRPAAVAGAGAKMQGITGLQLCGYEQKSSCCGLIISAHTMEKTNNFSAHHGVHIDQEKPYNILRSRCCVPPIPKYHAVNSWNVTATAHENASRAPWPVSLNPAIGSSNLPAETVLRWLGHYLLHMVPNPPMHASCWLHQVFLELVRPVFATQPIIFSAASAPSQ